MCARLRDRGDTVIAVGTDAGRLESVTASDRRVVDLTDRDAARALATDIVSAHRHVDAVMHLVGGWRGATPRGRRVVAAAAGRHPCARHRGVRRRARGIRGTARHHQLDGGAPGCDELVRTGEGGCRAAGRGTRGASRRGGWRRDHLLHRLARRGRDPCSRPRRASRRLARCAGGRGERRAHRAVRSGAMRVISRRGCAAPPSPRVAA
ncbi:hypothetical protein [Homoserinibacter gongjuensis]|uniref:hypothetical protein n=1 Tax=Homoserinibacter gongjuensis TaxID=1162968 RepID=UPI003D67DA84